MELETGVDSETPVQFLLFRLKVLRCLCHRDDLGLIDFIRSPVGHHGAIPTGEDVLHPISTFPIGEGDQKGVALFDHDHRSFVGPTRSAADVTDDRGAGLVRAGGSHCQWPSHLRKPAQGCLDGASHASRVSAIVAQGNRRCSVHRPVAVKGAESLGSAVLERIRIIGNRKLRPAGSINPGGIGPQRPCRPHRKRATFWGPPRPAVF
jgi:hypothetical protein